MGYRGYILGLYWGYLGILENIVEPTGLGSEGLRA